MRRPDADVSADHDAAIAEIAQRHGFSADAAREMLRAMEAGHGSMAQFNHREFSGSGQWMRGGMIMLSDMFDAGLKSRVAALCDDLAQLGRDEPAGSQRVEPGQRTEGRHWWPADLPPPDSSGGQNGIRYAYFAGPRRLAIERGGVVTVYDTLDHRIGGVSQQQPGAGALSFSSQHGPVNIADLPIVSPVAHARRMPPADAPLPDVFATLEKLSDLKERGILSDDEYAAKKGELLKRV